MRSAGDKTGENCDSASSVLNMNTEMTVTTSNRHLVNSEGGEVDNGKGAKPGRVNNNQKHNLKCIHMNARSICNKYSELELCVQLENPDIIGITETWLNNKISDNELIFDGYTIFRRDRINSCKNGGGGVMLLIRSRLNPVMVSDFQNSSIEFLTCSIECGRGEQTLIGICYRPDYSTRENDLELYEIISNIDSKYVVIFGDFNYSELRWGEEDTVDRSHPFVECIDNNFLVQLIDRPTRLNNYLDLLLSSDASIIENVTINEPFSTSDHQTFSFCLKGGSNKQKKNAPNFNYFKADYNQIRNKINELGWEELLGWDNVDDIWVRLKSNLLDLRDKFIGRKRNQKVKCKWLTKEVQRLREAKKKAWIKYQKSNRNKKFYEEYKTKLRQSVRENKRAKLAFETKLANNIKTDCKSFYSYVSSKSRSNSKIGSLKDENNKVISENKEKANLMNRYFSSVFTTENLQSIPEPMRVFNGGPMEVLQNITTTEQEVLQKLKSLNVNKSTGADEIHGKLLYELRYELVKPLTHLFNLSLRSGAVPQDWREANVTPLHKKGSKFQVNNYRPVSLTSVVGKIVEGIVKQRLVSHLEEHSLIKDSQHGFLRGRSCLTNLLDFLEDTTKELDQGSPVDIVYLDFSKAFDKVSHIRLVKKLAAHGIGGCMLEWIQSWLKNRRQRVFIDGEFSEWADVTSGVPQGSVLGPICFLIYINDIEGGLLSKLGKFADDSKLIKSIKSQNDSEILQRDLEKLEKWADEWQMEFNVDKCSVIHLGKSNPCTEYTLCNKALKCSDKERDLGVVVDKTLKFSDQSNIAVNRANATLGMIKRNVVSRNKDVITKLYKGLVRPKLEYCVQSWRPFLRKDIDKIEKVQRRATKMIFECRNLPYEDRLRLAGLTTLEQRRDRGDMLEVFKMVKGFNKINSSKMFTLSTIKNTRGHRYKLNKNRSRLEIRRNFFSQRIVNKWNSLPSGVVESDSVNSFKNRYDKFVTRPN